jgi:Luciferase-like monooxygenase
MQFGAYTFVETRREPATGEPVDVDKAFADVIEQIELADRVGLDVFGEHHRPDYAVSAPAVALAAAAARTKRIRLSDDGESGFDVEMKQKDCFIPNGGNPLKSPDSKK